jgi:hypothetical protein
MRPKGVYQTYLNNRIPIQVHLVKPWNRRLQLEYVIDSTKLKSPSTVNDPCYLSVNYVSLISVSFTSLSL